MAGLLVSYVRDMAGLLYHTMFVVSGEGGEGGKRAAGLLHSHLSNAKNRPHSHIRA